jgi:hypothetical protein
MVVQYSQLKLPPMMQGSSVDNRRMVVQRDGSTAGESTWSDILTGVYWYPRREGTWKTFRVNCPGGHGVTLPWCEMTCRRFREDLGGGHMRRECGCGRYVHLERVHGMGVAGFRYTVGRMVQRVDSHGIATVQQKVRFGTVLDWHY